MFILRKQKKNNNFRQYVTTITKPAYSEDEHYSASFAEVMPPQAVVVPQGYRALVESLLGQKVNLGAVEYDGKLYLKSISKKHDYIPTGRTVPKEK